MQGGTRSYLTAWAAWHPETSERNAALAESRGTTAEWVDRKLGIVERRIAGPTDTPAAMGAAALVDLCDRAGLAPSDLDVVIGSSSFDDHDMPAVAARIAALVGGPAFTFDVRAACSGWLVAVEMARSLVAAGRAEHVAVCVSEHPTSGVDPADNVSSLIFGDGAAATLVSGTRPGRGLEIIETAWHADNAEHEAVVLPRHGWFRMDGGRTRTWIEQAVPDLVADLLGRHDLTGGDLRALVCHQANLRLIERLAAGIGVPPERHWHNVEWAGNTNAAGAPSALAGGLDAHGDDLVDGDPILVVTVGAGLNVVGTLFRWVQDHQ